MQKEQNLSVYKTYDIMGLYEYMMVPPFNKAIILKRLRRIPKSESLQKLSSKLHSIKL